MAEVQRDTLGSREDTFRFLDMVSIFSTQAMMALGKVMNPATGKAEKNLDAARLFIDTLEMLERKTRGNLTPDEARVLQSALTDLRIMFVEETKAPAAPSTAPTPEPAKVEAPTDTAAASDESKVKYSKKYE